MRGYAGKFLEIDLSSRNVKDTKFSDEVLRDYIGGRGLATKVLWDRLGRKWETVDPLGPENILLVLTGPFTGYFPGTKVCVSGKSPQSNGVIGSTVAGEFGVDLKCGGYDGLIITGKAEKPCYIFTCDSQVEIKDASPIWGKKARETLRFLVRKSIEEIKDVRPSYGEVKEPSVLYIGPAGENKTRVAAVVAKYAHGAGYGGYGGVMGAKNLKAIVAKGFGPVPDVYDKEKVIDLAQRFSEWNFEMERFRRWGTGGGGYFFGAETSSEPVRNWQNEWHDKESYKKEEFDKYWVKKNWGDFGCPTTCLKLAVLKTGRFRGAICDNPDYELEAYLGTNLGIFTPEENIYLSYVSNELGLCGIQGGAVLGFAAELYEKGILTKKDLDGIEPKWANVEAFTALAEKVAFREGIGDILAEGVYRAALKLGKIKGADLLKYAVHEKGVAIGAHGVRSGEDFIAKNIAYACSVQGGDHTSAASLPLDQGGELSSIMADSAVLCIFAAFGIEDNEKINFYEGLTGWKLTRKEWYKEKAPRILHLQRAMLLLGGPDAKWRPKLDDDNPLRFWEPLPSGPYKGKTLDRKKFDESRLEYFAAAGWNENGVPKPETLRKLGLEDVEAKLKDVALIK
ncbi:MAG: aldehyde ferredoxin oxidoreductase [Candidatus Bathyarchaeota archaeon]|nr:aldehyde ferredoxin oxidoreductase [Candidatus Bathyarchaeota archaeon]MDH5495440.1 aldehyde ferredoxin oxidoreductase [Candidatus Bathyarchaeota archaeon]